METIHIITLITLITLFSFFMGLAFLINMLLHRQNKETAEALVNSIKHNVSPIIKNIKASVYIYTAGTRSGSYNRFRRCDLYFTKQNVIIIGYSYLFRRKIYANPIVLQQNDPRIKKVNPNSFNHEVYIDFITTENPFHNIEIHLKGMAAEERNLFSVLA